MRGWGIGLLLLLAVTTVLPAFHSLEASALTLTDVEEAIRLGIQAVYDTVRPITVNGATYYVMPDHPSPTVSIEYNGRLYVPGSFFDPGLRDYKTEIVSVTANSVSWRYYFNVDSDEKPDIVIYAELRNISYTEDQLFIYVDEAEYTFNLIVGAFFPYKYYNVGQGWSTTITIEEWNDYRFHSARYVLRHSTIIAAWLLEDEGYTYTATRMKELWDNVAGFNYDAYAPIFGRSTSYPDSFFDLAYSTWLGWNGYEGHPWSLDAASYYLNYPYKSRIYMIDSIPGLTAYDAIAGWKEFPLYKLLYAMHLLDKYGASKASQAEQLIAEAITEGGWDGYGLSRAKPYGVPWSYKGYPVYLNAALLAALVKYYQVTGDRWVAGNDILYMADRLAGILVRLQWDYEHQTPWGAVRLALFRGWWPAAYDVGSLVSKPSAWGIIDTATSRWDSLTGFLDKYLGVDVGEALRPMPSEWPFAVVNSESTILAVQALKLYLQLAQQLGRQPIDPTQPPSALWSGALAETGGGSTGCSSLTSYCASYAVSPDGAVIRVDAFTDIALDAWAYGYTKVRLEASEAGSYTVRVALMVHYGGLDSLGNTGYVYAVVKVIDAYDVMLEVVDTVAVIEKDVPPLEQGTKAVVIEVPVQLQPGVYYVEVGLRALADGSWIQAGGVLVYAVGQLDMVVLEPS